MSHLDKLEADILYVLAYPVRFAPLSMIVNDWTEYRPDVARKVVDKLVSKGKLRIETRYSQDYVFAV